MDRGMLKTSLIEDLNRLACAAEQERYQGDPERARSALERLRYIDTSEIDRFSRDGWLARDELDLLERFLRFARDRLPAIPAEADALSWTDGDHGWQIVRERANELLQGLDGYIDIGVAGWEHHSR